MKRNAYLAFIALALCACNNDKEEIHNDFSAAPIVYHVSVKASFDSQTKGVTFGADGKTITSQFETGDKIYVYNETKNAFARFAEGDQDLAYLQPESASISADGSSCTLEGNLSFYTWNDETDEWEVVTVEADDVYSLYYNMNDPNDYNGVFDYINSADGSSSSASENDFAEAKNITMTLSGTTLTVPDGVQFENLQSMFRQRLLFTRDDDLFTPGKILLLTVGTKNETLVCYYRPLEPEPFDAFKDYDIYDPVITSDGDIYLSLAFYYDELHSAVGDQLILTAVDEDGNVFKCSKDVPDGGFVNSSYYYGTCEMVWQYQNVKPTVTRSDDGDDDELIPNYGWYDIYGEFMKVSISGNSIGYIFWFNENSAEVTLGGNGRAISYADNNDFILGDADLTIVLATDYTIECPNYETAIWAGNGSDGGDLKLSTTGAEQTLTVRTKSNYYCGIYGYDNYDRGAESAPNNLAADGFTVALTYSGENSDGTYTNVYTVTPVE